MMVHTLRAVRHISSFPGQTDTYITLCGLLWIPTIFFVERLLHMDIARPAIVLQLFMDQVSNPNSTNVLQDLYTCVHMWVKI